MSINWSICFHRFNFSQNSRLISNKSQNQKNDGISAQTTGNRLTNILIYIYEHFSAHSVGTFAFIKISHLLWIFASFSFLFVSSTSFKRHNFVFLFLVPFKVIILMKEGGKKTLNIKLYTEIEIKWTWLYCIRSVELNFNRIKTLAWNILIDHSQKSCSHKLYLATTTRQRKIMTATPENCNIGRVRRIIRLISTSSTMFLPTVMLMFIRNRSVVFDHYKFIKLCSKYKYTNRVSVCITYALRQQRRRFPHINAKWIIDFYIKFQALTLS